MVKFDKHYFDRYYAHYQKQNPPRKIEWYKRIVSKYVDSADTVSICDIGCGGGAFLRSLPQQWSRVGIDPAGDILRKQAGVSNGTALCCGSLDHMPCKGTFTAVTLFDVLEHVEDIDAAAKTLNQLLLPGGYLLFVVPVYDGPLGPLVRMLDKDPTHNYQKSRWWWLAWVEKSFTLQEWIGVGRYFLARQFYIHQPTRLLRRFAPAIAVVAKKR